MKKLLALAFLLFASPALAQNPQCPTRPAGDSSNACASTAFAQGVASPLFITCPSHQWVSAIGASASVCSQPAFSDISGTLAASQFGPLIGDVTTSGYASTIAANAVTNAKLAQMAAATVKCNPTGGLANAQDCTLGQGFTLSGTQLQPNTGCTVMWPSPSQTSGSWNVVNAYGSAVSTGGTTSQGLQEAITYSINNGQCLIVYGQSFNSLGSQTATLNSTTTVTGLSSTASLLVGDYITASAGGIPTFTKITSIDSSTQIHINNAATVTASRTLSFARGAGVNLKTQITASATVSIPPVEQWSAQLYNVNLTCTSGVNGPCLQFDSAIIMDFNFQGGQIVYQPAAPGATSFAVLLKPTNPVPIDGNIQISGSRIHISTIAAPASGGNAVAVWGVDITGGSVLNNYFASEEMNGTGTGSTPNTNYGFYSTNAGTNTSFEQNILDFALIHLVATAGITEGTSVTNATHYNGNIYRIGSIRPGSTATCVLAYGSFSKYYGTCSNEEAGGSVAVGVAIQTTGIGNTVDFQTIGVTSTYTNTSGTFQNAVINGKPITFSQILGGSAGGVNFNSANTDTSLAIFTPTTLYRVIALDIYSCSATTTTATFTLNTAAAGAGTALVPLTTSTVSSAAANTNNNAMRVTPISTIVLNQGTIFFRIGTAQGSAATCTIVVYISPLP